MLVHTGQNSAPLLSDIFFEDLGVRAPDHWLGVEEADFARQIGAIMAGCHDVLVGERPDRLLVLGDTNSALSAVVAKRLGIPVFHMEAGNRCFDRRVPEEVNRRIVDHVSDVAMPYTERSRQNLLREGFPPDRVFVTGNPILEVMKAQGRRISASTILDTLGVAEQGFFLVTLHRTENVDPPERLATFAHSLQALGKRYRVPVIVSTHPRTRSRLDALGGGSCELVRYLEPFGFSDFLALEQAAKLVLSDSGTVQEECALLGVPNVTLRDVTERPETIECGSNILSGGSVEGILAAAEVALAGPARWQAPAEYRDDSVSDTVLRILAGYVHDLGG